MSQSITRAKAHVVILGQKDQKKLVHTFIALITDLITLQFFDDFLP